MNFDANQGIEITDEVRELIKKGIEKEGSQGKLAAAMGVPAQNVQNWRGTGRQKGEYILWSQWKKIRPYFVSRGLLDGSDPRWLTPSEMRSRLIDNSALVLSSTEKQLIEYYRNSTDAGRASIYATAQAQASLAKEDSSNVS